VNVFLEPRLTRDIDVTIVAGAEEVERLRTALAALGFESSLEVGDELPSGPDFVRFVKDEVFIEMQAAKTALQREVVDRATSLSGIRVATPEDLIILKLISDRPKDQGDLQGLAQLPAIDWNYVEHWAREWDVTERLERLRRP